MNKLKVGDLVREVQYKRNIGILLKIHFKRYENLHCDIYWVKHSCNGGFKRWFNYTSSFEKLYEK